MSPLTCGAWLAVALSTATLPATAQASPGPPAAAAPAAVQREGPRPRPKGHKRGQKPSVAGVVNVNRASEAELRLLPGVGRGRAAAIVAHRDARPFRSLDDLARMKGMKNLVRKLHAHLCVDCDTTLHPAAGNEG